MNKERYRKDERVGKPYTHMRLKVMDPELYEFKKAEDGDQEYSLRKKLGIVANKTPIEESAAQTLFPNSFSTKQALSRSVKKVKKELPFSPRKKYNCALPWHQQKGGIERRKI